MRRLETHTDIASRLTDGASIVWKKRPPLNLSFSALLFPVFHFWGINTQHNLSTLVPNPNHAMHVPVPAYLCTVAPFAVILLAFQFYIKLTMQCKSVNWRSSKHTRICTGRSIALSVIRMSWCSRQAICYYVLSLTPSYDTMCRLIFIIRHLISTTLQWPRWWRSEIMREGLDHGSNTQ